MKRNYIKLIFVLFIVFVTWSCKVSSPYKAIVAEYLKDSDSTHKQSMFVDSLYYNRKSYVVSLTYNREAVPRRIDGYLLGHSYGHHFEFDTYGTLEDYKYKTDAERHSYEVRFVADSMRYLEVGSPVVDYWRDETFVSNDSIKIIGFISSFPRQKQMVLVSSNGKDYNNVLLKKSLNMPFLEEAEIYMPIKAKTLFLKIETNAILYKWKGLEDEKSFLDTIIVH